MRSRTRRVRRSENEQTQTPLDSTEALEHIDEGLDRGVALGVDVHSGIGQLLEELVEAHDRVCAGHPGLPDLAPGQVADDAAAVGDPVEGVVVEGHRDPVGGGMNVGLHMGVAEGHGVAEGPQRVLRELLGPATR